MSNIFYPDIMVDSIYDIDINVLHRNNIEALIVDIDNTLVAWDQKTADEYAIKWIENLKNKGIKICLVSNNTKTRVIKFNEKLKLFAIYNANKPLKSGYLKALKYFNVNPENVAVIGDQIFSDVWGGNRLNMFTILVTPISPKDFAFTKIKRFFEKFVLLRYKRYNRRKK